MTQVDSPPRILPSADVDERAQIGAGTQVWHLAQVREDARIGAECTIGRGAYVGPGVVLGDRCKVQNHALVYEPAVVADGVFIGPGVVFTNDTFPRAVNLDGSLQTHDDWSAVAVTVDTGASIGARAVCVAPVRIGRWAMVAAGSVVDPRRPRLRPRCRGARPPGALGRPRRRTPPRRGRRPVPLPAHGSQLSRVRRAARRGLTGRGRSVSERPLGERPSNAALNEQQQATRPAR